MIAGFPVALLGVLFFLILINLQALKKRTVLYNQLYTLFTLIGILFCSYLTYVEIAVIHAVCFWCVTVFLIICALFMISVFRLKKQGPGVPLARK